MSTAQETGELASTALQLVELQGAVEAGDWVIVHATQYQVTAETRTARGVACVVGNTGGWWWMAFDLHRSAVGCNNDPDIGSPLPTAAEAIAAADAALEQIPVVDEPAAAEEVSA